MGSKPIVYLLCGLPGSGKTTYADEMTKNKNILKLSIDERMLANFGVPGKDYPSEKYNDYKKKVIFDIKQEIIRSLENSQSLILDFGVWRQKDRNFFRQFVEDNGAELKLVYFKANKELLLKRLRGRNIIENSTAINVDESILNDALAVFEEPSNEKELVIIQSD